MKQDFGKFKDSLKALFPQHYNLIFFISTWATISGYVKWTVSCSITLFIVQDFHKGCVRGHNWKEEVYVCCNDYGFRKQLSCKAATLPPLNHSHYQRIHHQNRHHILLHTPTHIPFLPLISASIVVRIASYIFNTIMIPILLPLIISCIIVWIDAKFKGRSGIRWIEALNLILFIRISVISITLV